MSFDVENFDRLECGKKKFEYRKHFPKGETTVCFYVSNPVKAITGIGYFGEFEELATWVDKYSDCPLEVKERIQDYLTDCNFVVPMYRFQKTCCILLDKLRTGIPDRIVP